MQEIKVFGHQSPDTDATVSAIVWAWFLREHRNKQAQAYVLGKPNTEALFVLDRWGFDVPPVLDSLSKEDVVSIVDTNNAEELFPNINDADIVSIVDHHKLTGGLKTSSPREIIIQPYASTMTVMFNVMNIEPTNFPQGIAGLMLSGIVSDTLEFRSPTTTDEDKALAHQLADALGIDISEYAQEMFAAKSDVSHMTDGELLRLDSKIFEIKDQKMRISVLETTDVQSILARREGILASQKQVQQEDGVDAIIFFVIDILNQEAVLVTEDMQTKTLVAQAFGVPLDAEPLVLPGVVSRKKQIIPALSR